MRKKAAKRIFAGILAAVCFSAGTISVPAAEPKSASAQVTVSKDGNVITIGNEYISREFSIADGKLSTTKITNKRTDGGDTVFVPGEGSEEFKVRMIKGDDEEAAPVLPAIDRSGWTATADSYQNATGPSDGNAPNLIDGNVNSIWHSAYNDSGTGRKEFPYNVLFKLGKATTFRSFSYTPRQDGQDANGNIKRYELYYSDSESDLAIESAEWKLAKKGSFAYNDVNPIYVNLDAPCTATQLKFKALSANNGQNIGGGAEFNLHEDEAPQTRITREFLASDLTLSGDPEVEDTEATINNVRKTGQKITFHFEPYTFRQVEYTIDEVIVMYHGDHFMRKYMQISVPEDQQSDAVIDYIDLESLKTEESDATWTIPEFAGTGLEVGSYKAKLGQPIYIQGMFFGCEFPAADTKIDDDGVGYMRYYTGKSFERLKADNQLTQDEKYVTWQTVAGAARSFDQSVIQADFFQYISSISTPSEFRIQYNSWFDNMMFIDDENIQESFIEMDREFNKAEIRPLDSYVVDDGWNNYNNVEPTASDDGGNLVKRSGWSLNQTGFWEFNEKFPNGLQPSSDLVHKFGSNFGVWIGPRGGYNYQAKMADILTKSGMGSGAGGSIDVADRVYVQNFQNMVISYMKEYGVNYWKWDGFANAGQWNQWKAADGVPGYAHNHMTGGYQNMYHVTDLWEAWIDLMEAARRCEQEDHIKNLWISLTCYVNPSPWFLQWANSVWIQCTLDQGDAGPSGSKMDRQITYRDAVYYEFLKKHEFQFPLSNIYNHDPVYGKTGTGMANAGVTSEQFQNYLYMLSTRGTAFWELYFSDSMMTDEKYEITGEFLEWIEENYHILRNAKMFGESPNTGTALGSNGGGDQNAYGFSCFDGTDGILSVRNSAATEKSVTIPFDRTIGVPESAGTLKYHMEHSYNLTDGVPLTGELVYGEDYTFTLQPDEVRILRISKDGDQTAPKMTRVYSDGENQISVKFNEKVTGSSFTVNGTKASVEASADGITFRLTVADGTLQDKSMVTVAAEDVCDLAGNELKDNTASFRFYKNNTLLSSSGIVTGPSVKIEADDSLTGNNGFTVSAKVYTMSTGAVLSQGDEYEIGINEDGTAYFELNGARAVTEMIVNDGIGHTITGVKENNGMLKIYVDGTLEGAAYNPENRYYEVNEADIVVGDDGFLGGAEVIVADTGMGYDAVEETFGGGSAEPSGEQNWAAGKNVVAKWTADGSDAAKGGDRPMSMAVDGTKDNLNNYGEFGGDNNTASSYMQVDLGAVRSISEIKLYRYWSGGRVYKGTVIALSENADFADKEIVYNSDAENFHQLGIGTDATYAESADGKSIALREPINARYVRVYMHGSDGGNTNHIAEIEVIGNEDEKEADYTAVDMAVEVANSLEKDDYKDFSAVEDAINAVVDGKKAAEQEAVNAMAADIFQALAALEKTVKKQLEEALEKAGKEDLSGYTQDSIVEYNKVLNHAKNVLENADATDEERKEAIRNVNEAKDLLVKEPENPNPPDDPAKALEAAKQALAEALGQAAAYQDASKYTEESWVAFQKALTDAKNAHDNASSAKETLEAAANSLKAAITALKPIEEGQSYNIGDYVYKVTSISGQTLEVIGVTNPNLKSITVPASASLSGKEYMVTSVGTSAFKNCKATKAVIGKNVVKIGNKAFINCKSLKSVKIDSTKLTQIGKSAFANCTKLKKITIKSKKLKTVGKGAFKKISKTAAIKVPAAKRNAYKSILAKGGLSGTAKIK